MKKILLFGFFALFLACTNFEIDNPDKAWTEVAEQAAWPARFLHSSVVLGEDIYVIGGSSDYRNPRNDVWKSSDGGATWTEVTAHAAWPARANHITVVLGEDIYVMGGVSKGGISRNDAWKSNDGGATWIELSAETTWPARIFYSSVVLGEDIYVMGGLGDGGDGEDTAYNDVWRSSDGGVTWTEVTAHAAWPARIFHSSVVLGEDIYVMGGVGPGEGREDTAYNDVWKSSDGGVTWIEVTAHAAWPARAGHSTVVLGKNIYVIGGTSDDETSRNDIWRSNDGGVTWLEITAQAAWPARFLHSSVILGEDIYVMGGASKERNVLNDVWIFKVK